MKKKEQDNLIDESIYVISYKKNLFAALLTLIFFLALMGQISLGKKLTNAIDNQIDLLQNRCPFNYYNFRSSFFPLPKIQLESLFISGSCLMKENSIELKNIDFSWRGFSFSPFGIKFKIQATLGNTPLEIIFVQGFSSESITIENNTIEMEDMITLTGAPFKGSVNVNFNTVFSKKDLSAFNLEMKAKRLALMPTNMQGLVLPFINIGPLKISANLKKIGNTSPIDISQFQLGENGGPLEIKLSGQIFPNLVAFNSSSLKLKTSLTVEEKLLNDFSLLNLILGKYKKDGANNFFEFKINGSLQSPQLGN